MNAKGAGICAMIVPGWPQSRPYSGMFFTLRSAGV